MNYVWAAVGAGVGAAVTWAYYDAFDKEETVQKKKKKKKKKAAAPAKAKSRKAA